MKSCIFLIILGFTQLVYCNLDSNLTDDDSYYVCPISLMRRKRAHAEYTRWRANQESSQEFIVKILDEDITTPRTKQVIAVNIQPITKGVEKIIVGGVMVPPPTTLSPPTDLLRDYTRFVPPTTGAVSHVDGEHYLAPAPLPKASNNISPIQPRGSNAVGRHSQRDDSPPAGPQFLARTPILMAPQFAPIAPVAFTHRTTIMPLTPPSVDKYNLRKTFGQPIRTTPLSDIILPTRTTHDSEEFRFQPFIDDEVTTNDIFLTRSTFVQKYGPLRSSQKVFEFTTADEFNILPTTKQIQGITKASQEMKNKGDIDSDLSYSMLFYNDDDNENNGKKGAQVFGDTYDDKNKVPDDVTEKEPLEVNNSEKKNNTLSDIIMYSDENQEDESDNITEKSLIMYRLSSSKTVYLSTPKLPKDKFRERRRQNCSMLKLRQLNFNSPRTLPEIVAQLKQWAEDSPVAKWVDITDGNYTNMENPIYMMIVDDPSSGQIVSAKQTVMVVAGIQGRDHHAVAAALYVLYQLIERSEAHADLLTKYRFWIIPIFNPDGYDYSMTFPHRREWKKNLRQSWDSCKGRESCHACETYGLQCTVQSCYGINLDRNFEYQWIPADELHSEHPCGELYAGQRQLSEAETLALTHFLHEQRTPLFTFIAFKEGDVLGVMYPYSHTRKKRAFDHIYRQRASRAASAAHSISARPYVAGQTSEFLPLYAGGIEDWVDGHLGIDNTYTIMMFRPKDAYNSKLITERVVHEAFAAMDTLLLQSAEPLGPKVTLMRSRSDAMALSTHLITALAVVTTHLLLAVL